MNTKSKFKIGIPIIIIIAVLGLVMPHSIRADIFPTAAEIASGILEAIVGLAQGISSFLVKAGAALFEGMLELGFKKSANIDTVNVGWQITRDFANMLFILFMIIIAFATILRIEGYGIKKLLPKVIIIALLINFSMVFCEIIIDFSNITASFFIQNIKSTLNGKSMTATFVDSLNLTNVQLSFANCNLIENLVNCDKTYIRPENQGKYNWENPEPGNQSLFDCYHVVRENYSKCETATATALETQSAARKDWTGVLNILISGIVGSILLLIAAFTLFAGAIMLLFRILAIWFLVMIVPLAFICYIMPGLQSNWEKWWSTFLNWCIFAPAYSFFIWLAIKVCVENANIKLATSVNYTFTQFMGGVGNPFIQDPGEQLLGYALIIGLLIGGLIVAQNLGIYGASAVMKIATDTRKGAAGWMKRQAMRPAKTSGSRLASGALGLTGKLFGGFKLGGRLQARAVQVRQARLQTIESKKVATRAKTMTDSALLNEIETGLIPTNRLVHAQEALNRGLLAKTSNRNAVRKSLESLQGYGFAKEAKDLRDIRIDIVTPNKLEEEIKKVLSKKEQGKWNAAVFEPEEGRKVIETMIETSGGIVSDFLEKFRGLNRLTQLRATERMTELFNDDFGDAKNVNARRMYAAVTGEVASAFRKPVRNEDGLTATDENGIVKFDFATEITGPADTALKQFVKGMKPKDFAELDLASVKDIAKHIDTSVAIEIGRYISGDMKEAFAKNFTQEVKKQLAEKDAWKSYLKPPRVV
ncbi:MAG TPA: hypothetical protein VMW82_01070 [Candidatus Paceibacterota bacterium]|nr:hypothetical protein [Candidatus Paceibacterota bacterium]